DDFHRGTSVEIVVLADHAHSVLLHGAKMRTAGVQRYVITGTGHLAAHIGPHGSRANDQEPHCLASEKAAATARRWILPVAVRGMVSTMWTFLGHLKSASRSRQYASSKTSDWGSRKTTATSTSSPQVAWGLPKATASATHG